MNDRGALRATAPAGVLDPTSVEACCAILYGDPAIELVLGESLHPGGLPATAMLLDASGVARGSRLLDVGCGTGASSWLAATRLGLTVTGIDPSETAIMRARARGSGSAADPTFVVGTATDLPFEDGSFDAVLAECVLSTLGKDAALAEMSRVVRPGGRLVLSDMTIDLDEENGSPAGFEAIHPLVAGVLCLGGAWRPGQLRRALESAGFSVDRESDEGDALEATLERVAARLDVLRVVARDLVARLEERFGIVAASAIDDVETALASARAAAGDRRIGYTSITATRRASSRPSSRPAVSRVVSRRG